MQLTDPSVIATLTSVAKRERRKPYPRRARSSEDSSHLPKRRRACQCGACVVCLDNARWAHIFQEKFEDPDYYRPRSVWGGSSLA
jgi:hypothetical protein